MYKKIFCCLLVLSSINVTFLYAHGHATHIAVGRATYPIWSDFDQAFYDSLIKTPANYIVDKGVRS
jgi:hypothetical protein